MALIKAKTGVSLYKETTIQKKYLNMFGACYKYVDTQLRMKLLPPLDYPTFRDSLEDLTTFDLPELRVLFGGIPLRTWNSEQELSRKRYITVLELISEWTEALSSDSENSETEQDRAHALTSPPSLKRSKTEQGTGNSQSVFPGLSFDTPGTPSTSVESYNPPRERYPSYTYSGESPEPESPTEYGIPMTQKTYTP